MTLKGSRCQCAVCGEYFTRARWFDRTKCSITRLRRHRVGPYTDRWCLSELAMEALGMVRRQVGEEGIWGGPRMPLEALTARRQAVQVTEGVG